MRLTYLLTENEATNKPQVNALLALMCFHASRFEARINQRGEVILYEEQDKNLWDQELIQKGNYFLIQSAKGEDLSKYHLEASIAYWHSTKIENPNKWENILQLYNRLLQLEYSPIAALNRTYALFMVSGKEKAIAEALKLDLKENHFYHSLLGHLYTNKDNTKAIFHYEEALRFVKSTHDRSTIKSYVKKLKT